MAEFLYHLEEAGAVIDDVQGDLSQLMIPECIEGLRVIRASIHNAQLQSDCRALVVPETLEELNLKFEGMYSLEHLELPERVHLTCRPDGLNDSAWFLLQARGAVYAGGYYCGTGGKREGKLEIREGCIGVTAMADCFNSWEEIFFPASVRTIGWGAFDRSDRIESIEFSEGLKKIERHAFYECPKLRRVWIPESCACIEKMAFYQCKAMEEMSMPEHCYREMSAGSPYPCCDLVIIRGEETKYRIR